MNLETRIAIVIALIIVDAVAIVIPLTAIVFAIIILMRPISFLKWVHQLYDYRPNEERKETNETANR